MSKIYLVKAIYDDHSNEEAFRTLENAKDRMEELVEDLYNNARWTYKDNQFTLYEEYRSETTVSICERPKVEYLDEYGEDDVFNIAHFVIKEIELK